MRGSTPLDVAAASVMDNYELALALTEPDLEKVRTTGVYCAFSYIIYCIGLAIFYKMMCRKYNMLHPSGSWHELKFLNLLLSYSHTHTPC